jgi:hypothetical protein
MIDNYQEHATLNAKSDTLTLELNKSKIKDEFKSALSALVNPLFGELSKISAAYWQPSYSPERIMVETTEKCFALILKDFTVEELVGELTKIVDPSASNDEIIEERLIWIDKNVDNGENKGYAKVLRDTYRLVTYKGVRKAVDFIINNPMTKYTVILSSGVTDKFISSEIDKVESGCARERLPNVDNIFIFCFNLDTHQSKLDAGIVDGIFTDFGELVEGLKTKELKSSDDDDDDEEEEEEEVDDDDVDNEDDEDEDDMH